MIYMMSPQLQWFETEEKELEDKMRQFPGQLTKWVWKNKLDSEGHGLGIFVASNLTLPLTLVFDSILEEDDKMSGSND